MKILDNYNEICKLAEVYGTSRDRIFKGCTEGSLIWHGSRTELKTRASRITGIKFSFSRISKISKEDTLLNNPFFHQRECLKEEKS